MSTEKTDWVNLQVTMSARLKATLHDLCRIAGTNASNWCRNLALDALPALVEKAERRKAALVAMANGESISPGSRRNGRVAKRSNAARRKERQAGKARRKK